MEGFRFNRKSSESDKEKKGLGSKLLRAAVLGAAIHGAAGAAEAHAAPSIDDASAATTESLDRATALKGLGEHGFAQVAEHRRAELQGVYDRATPEQKKIIRAALADNETHHVDSHDKSDPDVLILEQVVCDLEEKGEMRPNHAGVKIPGDAGFAQYADEKAEATEGTLTDEEMQPITIETATPAQIENWIKYLRAEKK